MTKIFKFRFVKLLFYFLILAGPNVVLTAMEAPILQPIMGVLLYGAILSIFFDCYKKRLPAFMALIAAAVVISYVIAYQLSQNQLNKIEQEFIASQNKIVKVGFDIKSDKLVFGEGINSFDVGYLMQFYDFPAIYQKTSDPKKFISYSIFDQDFCRQLTEKLGLKSSNDVSAEELAEEDRNDIYGTMLIKVRQQFFSAPNSEISLSYFKNFQPISNSQTALERHKTIRNVCLLKQIETLESDRIFYVDSFEKRRSGFIFSTDETHIKITTPQKEEINLIAGARTTKEPFFIFFEIDNEQKGYGTTPSEKIMKIFSITGSNLPASARMRSGDEVLEPVLSLF